MRDGSGIFIGPVNHVIVHLFNSSVVSGPETLAIPALKNIGQKVAVIFLSETRLGDKSEGPIQYARSLGYEVYSVPVRSRWDQAAFLALRDLIDQIAPEIIHAHDVKASVYLLQAKRKRAGFKPKIVSTHHGVVARKGLIRLYEQFYVRFILPSFDAVLSVCSLDQKSLLSRGISPARLHIHLNGVDRPLVRPEERALMRERIRRQWRESRPDLFAHLPEETLFVGAVARLSSEKRHDRMIRALHLLLKERPGFQAALLFFGIGPLESDLRTLAQSLGVEKNVIFMGYSKTIGQEMSGLDLLLCLSDGEGIPINLIEAGWSGTPVFSTAVGGIPDLINSERVGFLVRKEQSDQEIAQALLVALSDRPLLSDVGATYQRRITENFSEKAWLDQLRSIYSQISSDRPFSRSN